LSTRVKGGYKFVFIIFITGLYVSGAMAGTLSSVSSAINSMTTIFITDFIKLNEMVIFKNKKSEKFYTWLSKFSSVLFGLLCISFAYVASNLGNL
jgi:Na+/proline symporter